MGGDINQKHLGLNEKLAKEVNKLSKAFSIRNYSKIENIDGILLKRDLPVEKKKSILIKKLHEIIAAAFSVNKSKFNKKAFDLLKNRLHNTRKIIHKLRSINYYLETVFVEELGLSKFERTGKSLRPKQERALARDELEALEYTAYNLIVKVVMLDKRLLKGYAHKERKVVREEKSEAKCLGFILKKESELLEHLEAKLPPPKAASMDLMKEPKFTDWVSRVFSLLSYLEYIYAKESSVFSKLKKNRAANIKISRKITHLAEEKSKLLKIMEEKEISMKASKIDDEIKRGVHGLTATINL